MSDDINYRDWKAFHGRFYSRTFKDVSMHNAVMDLLAQIGAYDLREMKEDSDTIEIVVYECSDLQEHAPGMVTKADEILSKETVHFPLNRAAEIAAHLGDAEIETDGTLAEAEIEEANIGRYTCLDCGETYRWPIKDGSNFCRECGGDMELEEMVGA